MQSPVADAEKSCATESSATYTGPIDPTPPDTFEWKSVSETMLTVDSTTEMHLSVQSKPFSDIDSFHDLDSHAAEVIYVGSNTFIPILNFRGL